MALPKKFEMPKVDFSKVELPKVTLPKMEFPKVELPKIDLHKLSLPNIELTDILQKFEEIGDSVSEYVSEEIPKEIKEITKYSKLDTIPNGQASNHITPGCLVLEGGAFRSLYTQGICDYFMENDLNLQCTVGVSAGALSGMAYSGGYIGRCARINLGYRHDSRFIGLDAFKQSGSPIRLDFLFQDYLDIEPFDDNRFPSPGRRFVAVATDCDTGEAHYFEKGNCHDMISAVKASASMPFISKMVDVDGHPCLDGGCSCAIPYQWAINQGYKKIIVIKTRDMSYREENKEWKVAQKFYHQNEQFGEKLLQNNFIYNKQLDELEELSAKGRIFLIAPETEITVGRVEYNMEKLGELYWQGYHQAEKIFNDVKKYLTPTT